jgi:hypothetical protein
MELYLIFGFPLAIFVVARVSLPNVRFEFDFDTAHSTFFLLYDRLAKIAWMIFGFGLVGAFMLQRFAWAPGRAPAILLASSIYALLFNTWMIVQYESYLVSRYPRDGSNGTSSYTPTKYSITFALGLSCIVLFIAGAIMAMRLM